MKDIVAIVAILALASLGFCGLGMLVTRHPLTIVGVPAGARCGWTGDDGTRTCVADGIAYTCVTDWDARTITCGRRSAP